MASRLYLIIFAGLLLAHGLSFGLMFYERYQSATTVMLNTLEHDVGTSVAVLDRLPADGASALARAAAAGQLPLHPRPGRAGHAVDLGPLTLDNAD